MLGFAGQDFCLAISTPCFRAICRRTRATCRHVGIRWLADSVLLETPYHLSVHGPSLGMQMQHAVSFRTRIPYPRSTERAP